MESSPEELNVVPYDFAKKFFPSQVNGKLNTLEFLEASKGVVKLIEHDLAHCFNEVAHEILEFYNLGKVFSPLSSDINGNIEKIKKCYDKNPEKYVYIEDMILSENKESNIVSIDALLWLRRALHFVLIFFQNILNDPKKNECLQEHMSSAYSEALEPYHGWVSRQLFKFFKKVVPNRSALFSAVTSNAKEEERENFLKLLHAYMQTLADNVQHITSFYKEYNLDTCAKV